MAPTFVIDVGGHYGITLTVSNGVATDSASVTREHDQHAAGGERGSESDGGGRRDA